jgi:hypothetical protein
MSTAPPRTPPILGRVLRGIAWTALFAVLAAGGAGLVGQTSHAPGSPARAELTAAGDQALDARLDVATEQLRTISTDIDTLAEEAKTALEEISSFDPARLQASLQRGGTTAAAIDTEARALRDSLSDLPGDGPNAVLEYSNATLVRRSAILAAVDAALSIAGQWQTVTTRASGAGNLTELITRHDSTVFEAAANGRGNKFGEATEILDGALLIVADILAARTRLIASQDPTVLDEWIERNRDYDLALRALYDALDRSKGKLTVEVQSARRDERIAFDKLPPDRRTIVVIVVEVARGGLIQAVVAIEDAHGHVDEALAEAG